MTVESNYVIAIATLSDGLKKLAPEFQPIPCTHTLYPPFFPRFEQVIGNCSEF